MRSGAEFELQIIVDKVFLFGSKLLFTSLQIVVCIFIVFKLKISLSFSLEV
jgi:hypothetical protein